MHLITYMKTMTIFKYIFDCIISARQINKHCFLIKINFNIFSNGYIRCKQKFNEKSCIL